MISRITQLKCFLESIQASAVCCLGSNDKQETTLYTVNGESFVVIEFRKTDGFEIYTQPTDSAKIADILSAVRGCGMRKKSGVYLTVSESPFGSPLENFLIDPPILVGLQELGIGPRGVHLIERNGVTHVLDVVGRQHYPNVRDFIEEARYLGVSRRAELPDYSRLTRQSRLVLIHERAHIQNWTELYAAMSEPERAEFKCPSGFADIWTRHQHKRKEMCVGLYGHDVEQMREEEGAGCRISGVRDLPCGANYRGWRAECNFFPEYHHAIFASFPIGGIEVVEDPDDRQHERKMDLASRSALPVSLVEG